jgi:hypothetical protein
MTLIPGAFEVEHDVSGIHTLTQGSSLGKTSAIGRKYAFTVPVSNQDSGDRER